ncbi:MAG: hypothetical protein HYY13_01050 [Nitrospirae bacterium]|nr:hypothetical protein [Nitrospirota bacterium]
MGRLSVSGKLSVRWSRVGLAALSACALAACGVSQSYYKDLDRYISTNQAAAAMEHVQKNAEKEYASRNRLLYYFDLALTAHLAGDYQKSNEALAAAEKAIEDFYTKSVSAQAASFLVNDNVKEYASEDFEMVIVHVIGALNYLFMGDLEGALVEARKVDLKLKVVAERAGGKKIAYQTDAFARYLAGLIQDNQGSTEELNDAFISYRQALEAYSEEYLKNYKTPVPTALVNDVLRTAAGLGFSEEAEEIRKKYAPDAPAAQRGKPSSEIVVFHYTGLAPEKVDFVTQFGAGCGAAVLQVQEQEAKGEDLKQIKTAMKTLAFVGAVAGGVAAAGNCSGGLYAAYASTSSEEQGTSRAMRAVGAVATSGNTITVAIPDFKRRPFPIKGSEIVVGEATGPGVRSELVEDIEAIGVQSLKDRIGRVLGKAVARATVKFALAQGSGKLVEKAGGGGLMAWAVKSAVAATGSATEEADKRSWRTLPAQIRIARLPVAPGEHTVTVRLLDANGRAVEARTISGVKVTAGKRTFVRVVTMQGKGGR